MLLQSSLFDFSQRDVAQRQQKLVEQKDFLERLGRIVRWEDFRGVMEAGVGRATNGMGRPPYDAVLLFKMLVLQALYNLSDEETEYQILDRLSFQRFLGLELKDRVPDARTVWTLRDALAKSGGMETLFARFDAQLAEHGFVASGGQMIDATFVEAPRQRNNREENQEIKAGKTPESWSAKKRAHKDTDARWTKKNNVTFFGYKNHSNVDRDHKLIRRYDVTDASVHDSQKLDAVLLTFDEAPDLANVWADSAYRSEEQEQRLRDRGYVSHIHERAYRNRPLTDADKAENRMKSKIRARAEHVFGHIENSMRGCYVRTIGLARAKVKIGAECLAYNLSRFAFLMRNKAQSAPA